MSRLLLGVVLLGNLSICVTEQAPEVLAPPAQVRFDSVDYRNVLHWSHASNSTTLQYFVQWKIYGEPEWLDVAGCQGILKQKCDLSGVTSEPREWYYARVRASSLPSSESGWILSPRFNPSWGTKISPPTLKLNVTEQGIMVYVNPPPLPVRKIHRNLQFKIYLTDVSGKEVEFEMDRSSKRMVLKKLNHKMKYCVQAQTVIPLQTKSSERSSEKCVTTI
ncbi:interleukin-22 receptor subunit alpha-2 [Aulostomus maculatus]